MAHLVLTSLVVILLVCQNAFARRLPQEQRMEDSEEMDNSINSNTEATDGTTSSVGGSKIVDWVRISVPPAPVISKPAGSRLELECEAVGSPAPVVQWLKGGRPLTENESYKTNLINDREGRGLAKVRARLVMHTPLLEGHAGLYTCVAESGSQIATSHTKLEVTRSPMSGKNFSQLMAENLLTARSSPRVVLYDTIYMDNIGEDIILPCTVVGTPRPIIVWLDPNEQVLNDSKDERIIILPDGGLRIRGIRWNDMGPYTCLARNNYGEDNITTFLYPMLAEK